MLFLAKAYSLLAEGPQSHCDLDNICHPGCMNHHFRNHSHIVHLSQQPYYHRLLPQQLLKWIMRLFTALFNNTRSPKFKSLLTIVFLLPSIIIMITSNYPWNSETHKVDWNTITAFRNHKPMSFWTRWSKLLFPKRYGKMIYGSEEGKGLLAFELQSSCVSNPLTPKSDQTFNIPFSNTALSKIKFTRKWEMISK